MPLLIDGHNVIGAEVFDDIRLSDEDDEVRFAERVRAWQSRYGGKITIIFDRGVTEGRSPELSGGGVETRFARNPVEADDLIRRRLRRRPPGLILVTNDFRLRQEAQLHNVEVWRAEEFVQRMTAPPKPRKVARKKDTDPGVPAQEVDEMLRLFQEGERTIDDPTWTPPFKRPKRRRAAKPLGTDRKKKKDGKRRR